MARLVLSRAAHHLTQRGVRSMAIFHSDPDRREYLRLLAEQGERSGLRLLAYCLMSDHVHLVSAVHYVERNPARAVGDEGVGVPVVDQIRGDNTCFLTIRSPRCREGEE